MPEIFVNARRVSLTRSGIEYLLHKHVQTASRQCPSLATKRVFPHLLRHTCALTVLQATKDLRKVSLWLGHAHMQTTEIYTRADPRTASQARSAVVVTFHNGRLRSRRPLENTINYSQYRRDA